MENQFIVRTMLPSDLKMAMELAISEGWNQTEKDWRLLLDNKLNVCIAAESNRKVIGTATAINYADLEAWIGMVLVNKEYRRQGIGRMLTITIMEHLKEFRSVKLDATPAGLPVYKKLGFIEEYLLYRMVCSSFNGVKAEDDPSVSQIQSEDMDDIVKFDSEVFGVDRSYLINTIRNNYPGKAFLLRRNGKVKGYILGRDGVRFNYVGPVFAGSTADAILLLSHGLNTIPPGSAVAIDVMHNRKELTGWLEQSGFETQRQFTRMFLGSNPFPGKAESQYLISGPEFG